MSLLPETRGALGVAIMDAIESTGLPYAVLHGESDLADARVSSDIDLACDRPPEVVLQQAAVFLGPAVAAPLILWNSDVGTLCSYWFTPTLEAGVQLDLTFDESGSGLYGMRSRELVAARVRGSRYFRLPAAHEVAYLVSKGMAKGLPSRVDDAINRLKAPGELERTLDCFSLSTVTRINAAIAGSRNVRNRTAGWMIVSRLKRAPERLLRPSGCMAGLVSGPAQEAGALVLRDRLVKVMSASYIPERPLGWLDAPAIIRPTVLIGHATSRKLDRRRPAWWGALTECRADGLCREFYRWRTSSVGQALSRRNAVNDAGVTQPPRRRSY